MSTRFDEMVKHLMVKFKCTEDTGLDVGNKSKLLAALEKKAEDYPDTRTVFRGHADLEQDGSMLAPIITALRDTKKDEVEIHVYEDMGDSVRIGIEFPESKGVFYSGVFSKEDFESFML